MGVPDAPLSGNLSNQSKLRDPEVALPPHLALCPDQQLSVPTTTHGTTQANSNTQAPRPKGRRVLAYQTDLAGTWVVQGGTLQDVRDRARACNRDCSIRASEDSVLQKTVEDLLRVTREKRRVRYSVPMKLMALCQGGLGD
ncbi:hypothetical protein EI94DRAFT_1702582 [Lactarius quietus]|nr:hypothetical protein EI94DRAFT_1702582 [Lactarius quietus]